MRAPFVLKAVERVRIQLRTALETIDLDGLLVRNASLKPTAAMLNTTNERPFPLPVDVFFVVVRMWMLCLRKLQSEIIQIYKPLIALFLGKFYQVLPCSFLMALETLACRSDSYVRDATQKADRATLLELLQKVAKECKISIVATSKPLRTPADAKGYATQLIRMSLEEKGSWSADAKRLQTNTGKVVAFIRSAKSTATTWELDVQHSVCVKTEDGECLEGSILAIYGRPIADSTFAGKIKKVILGGHQRQTDASGLSTSDDIEERIQFTLVPPEVLQQAIADRKSD